MMAGQWVGKMIKKQLVVFVGLAILAGCSSTKNIPPIEAQKQIEAQKKQNRRVDRGLNVSYEDLGLGGAAFNKPDYIHVLGPSSLVANNESALIEQQKNIEQKNIEKNIEQQKNKNDSNMKNTISEYSSGVKGKGYSLYELSRWERFCDSGNGMDERDWLFIEKEKGETGSIPSDLVGQCNPPQHTYQDYLAAWTQFCTSQKMTNEQRKIVRSSTRPFTVVNPCKAIK